MIYEFCFHCLNCFRPIRGPFGKTKLRENVGENYKNFVRLYFSSKTIFTIKPTPTHASRRSKNIFRAPSCPRKMIFSSKFQLHTHTFDVILRRRSSRTYFWPNRFSYVAFASAIVYLVSRGSLTKRSGQFLVCFVAEQKKNFLSTLFLVASELNQLWRSFLALYFEAENFDLLLITSITEFSKSLVPWKWNWIARRKKKFFFCFVIGGGERKCLCLASGMLFLGIQDRLIPKCVNKSLRPSL